MNGKAAKKLRKIAEQETVGQPKVAYYPPETHPVRMFNPFTRQVEIAQIVNPIELSSCTRKLYKLLKRRYSHDLLRRQSA